MQSADQYPAELTDAQRRHFSEHGYVRLRGVLTTDEIAMLRQAMARAQSSFELSPNSYNVTVAADSVWNHEAVDDRGPVKHDLAALAAAIRAYDLPRLADPPADGGTRGNFLLDTGVWRRVPELAKFALGEKIAGFSAQLLNVPAIRYYDDQMFIKEAGAVDRAAFHQDLPYFHLDGNCGCVFWIPLNSVRAGGGRVGYIPGSHRWHKMFKANVFISELPFPGAEGETMPQIEANPEAYGVQYLEAEPGDVLVHHFLTVHGSEGNRSNTLRAAFSLRYCDAELRYRHRPGAPAQPQHKTGLKDGDPLDDDIHPIVWPKTRRTGKGASNFEIAA
ncbi:MAG: phytanoyl-CoA dioxygenase family protein [Alphaproteobacteria bacterium]|nr:phytanoyl-CoA dioxygenase family protein [Alphaproteobacteria bacterium]